MIVPLGMASGAYVAGVLWGVWIVDLQLRGLSPPSYSRVSSPDQIRRANCGLCDGALSVGTPEGRSAPGLCLSHGPSGRNRGSSEVPEASQVDCGDKAAGVGTDFLGATNACSSSSVLAPY